MRLAYLLLVIRVFAATLGCAGPAPADGSSVDAPAVPTDAPPNPADAAPNGSDAFSAVDAATDAAAPDGGLPWLVPPAVACAPAADACSVTTAESGIYASYRKDFFFPYSRYAEASIPDPSSGGRVQIVTSSAVTGAVTGVDIDGQSADALLAADTIEWYHVWPRQLIAGQPVWVSFHSRLAHFDQIAQAPIAIHTDAGDAAAGMFPLARPLVPVTYVTTTEDRSRLLVWVRNQDTSPHTMQRLIANGHDVTAVACIPSRTLLPGDAALWTVPLCTPLAPGAAWTVAVEYADAPAAVGAGRVVNLHFPIEHWPSSSECAFPTGNMTNFDQIRSHGIDTALIYTAYSGCTFSPADVIANQLVPNDFYVMVDSAFPRQFGPDSRVLAVMLGDESDSGYDPSNPGDRLAQLAARSLDVWHDEPAIASYVGGSRHRFTGTFAGVTDIQGMDFYVAACAPHITDFGTYPPLRGAYDYAVATRNNQAPLPTWIYAQGFHSGWNGSLGITIDRQPNAAELRIQAVSAIAAGAKGLMWFQGQLSEAARNAASFAEMGTVDHEIGALRTFLREGDPTGAAQWTQTGLVAEAIRSQKAIVVPIIDVASSSGPSDLACAAQQDQHWAVSDVVDTVTVRVPEDFGLYEVFEVADGQIAPAAPAISGRDVRIQAALSASHPARLFILAGDPSVRATVQSAL